MIIYGALLIPLITAFVLYRYFNHRTIWWEFCIPLGVSLAFIVAMKLIIEVVQVRCDEYWGSFVSRVEYYEDWNEYIHRICTRSCGKNCITTYDCSYVQYHPPRWEIRTTTNETVSITKTQYNEIKSLFKNESFAELNRRSFTNDGDLYYSEWANDSIRAIPVTTTHTYENRIKAADQSVFHFSEVKEVDVKKYSIKDYPEIYDNYKMDVVIGDSTNDGALANKKLQYYNSLLGHKKEVKMFVFVFKNQPIEAALYQEWFLSGANMNEFILCIGIDDSRNVKWSKVLSWTRSETLKAEVKSFAQNQTSLNLSSIVDFMATKVSDSFKRRDFKEFSYLTVEPPLWAVILTYLLTIGINFGLSYWIINNEHE